MKYLLSHFFSRTLETVYPYYIKAPSDSLAKPIKQLLTGMYPGHGKQSAVEKSATPLLTVMEHLGLKYSYTCFYLMTAGLGKDESSRQKMHSDIP